MLKHSEVQKFIASTGIKKLSELYEYFAKEDKEILKMALTYLTKKNRIKTAEYQAPYGPEKIYYTPKQ